MVNLPQPPQDCIKPVKPYDCPLAEFRTFMQEERGLSPITVDYRCRIARLFLDGLLEEKRSLETITASDIDSLLSEKVNREHYARTSLAPGLFTQLTRM